MTDPQRCMLTARRNQEDCEALSGRLDRRELRPRYIHSREDLNGITCLRPSCFGGSATRCLTFSRPREARGRRVRIGKRGLRQPRPRDDNRAARWRACPSTGATQDVATSAPTAKNRRNTPATEPRSVRAATSSLACGSSTPATGADYHFRLAARRARQSHDQDVASKEVGGREDLGPIQDSGELRTRSHTRREVRPLQVHVSPARSGRMQVGPGADPRHRNLRPLHSSQRPLRHLVSVGTHARRVKAETSDTRSHGR